MLSAQALLSFLLSSALNLLASVPAVISFPPKLRVTVRIREQSDYHRAVIETEAALSGSEEKVVAFVWVFFCSSHLLQ